MRSIRLILAILVFIVASVLSSCARAQEEICIKRYLASPDAKALGFSPAEIETLVTQEANAIGLSPQGITIIPCEGVNKVRSNYIDGKEIPKGDYILYDPIWVREVLGPDIQEATSKRARDEATFLFGHELGHLLGRHFTANEGLPRLEKEKEADRFAGCAAGALGADWSNISAFISRVRSDKESIYPSRSESLSIAKMQFDNCRGRGVLPIKNDAANSPSHHAGAEITDIPSKTTPVVPLSKCAPVQGQTLGGLCRFSGGAIRFVSGMVISVDGAPEAKLLDQMGVEQTAYQYPSTRTPLNSEEVPYIGLPPSFLRTFHLRLGDMCAVTYSGKTAYAIVGDTSHDSYSVPNAIDGSIALARRLGIEPIRNGRIQSDFTKDVTYLVFPQSGRTDLNPVDARSQITQTAENLLRMLVVSVESEPTDVPPLTVNPDFELTSDILKKAVRWYAEKPILNPNASDPSMSSQHSLSLDLAPELLSQIASATWVIHDSKLHYTAYRKNSEHLEFPFTAFGCWDLATVTVQLTDGRSSVIADFNECKAKTVSTRPGG